ncbi:MAG: hypothetical protein KAT65_03445 [Methanophagales archaeon]|nr:hypothetical protein [Methanophagales archaeon]
MTVYCSICDKKLGIFDRKYDVLDENGNLVKCCKDCKIAHEERIRKENVKVMKGIISKYLKKNGWTVKVFYEDVDYIENSEAAEYAKTLNTSGISRDDMWDMLTELEDIDGEEDIYDDLEKMRKLFQKRGVDTDEDEIISLFAEVVREEVYREIDEGVMPAYKEISKKLGENSATIEIIKQFLKMPLDHSTPVINIMRISRLLSKFNIKKDEKIIGEILEKLSEEAELEEFEEELM